MKIHQGNAVPASARVSVVTGGTEGIGRAVALGLARGGDRVLFVGRDPTRGAEVLEALRAIGPGQDHAFLRADLSLLADTAELAAEIARRTERIDAVVCCAGVLSTVPGWTSEGLEYTLVLNYLSRFLLAQRLLPWLTRAPSGRLVLVANAGKYADTLDFDDLEHRQGKPGLAVAGRTQFANDLFATELAARLRETRVEVTCVFPGVVKTRVFENARGLPGPLRALGSVIQALFGLTPEAAAETPVFLAQSPEAAGTSGRFYGPKRARLAVPERALRQDRRNALWNASVARVRAVPCERPWPSARSGHDERPFQVGDNQA
jgi:NAD(P)-dependent dehydrogenase (short-subunit alcohol dehydrogenase family)